MKVEPEGASMSKYRHRRPYYISILAMVLFIGLYFAMRRYNASDASELVVTILVIIAGVAFWLEYHHNSQINEAEFIVELNNQFLINGKLGQVEHNLERYNDLVRRGKTTEAALFTKELEESIYAMEKEDRQYLVNYLVHLEGIATLVNTGVLRLSTINDLMAYRYEGFNS